MTYADIALFRASMKIQHQSMDDSIRSILRAVDAAIDQHCGQSFTLDAAVTPRIFLPQPRRSRRAYALDEFDRGLTVDPIGSTIGLVVEVGTTTWLARDASTFETRPLNSLLRGVPITSLESLDGDWLGGRQRVRVTARWGWPTVPPQVAEAALLWAARLWKRRDSPEGVIGSSEWGTVRVPRADPDIVKLLEPLRLDVPGMQ